MLTLRQIALGLVAALIAAGVSADITLHPLFSDHMVLQQGTGMPVWGRAAPGVIVSVPSVRTKGVPRPAKACVKG